MDSVFSAEHSVHYKRGFTISRFSISGFTISWFTINEFGCINASFYHHILSTPFYITHYLELLFSMIREKPHNYTIYDIIDMLFALVRMIANFLLLHYISTAENINNSKSVRNYFKKPLDLESPSERAGERERKREMKES